MLYEGGEIDAPLVSLALMINSSTIIQLRNAAPLLYSICWQQLNFLIMFYVTFIHPKYGLQHTDRPTKEQMAKWLSYMIAFHSITNVNVYEGGQYNNEKLEYEGGKRINLTIPKWS